MKEKEQRIIIKDPLYKVIFINPKHKKFIDSKEFQRLRYIKQVTFVDFVYPNANHTRFSHSLGTYHLMGKVINNGLMNISKTDKELLLQAALMHDLGHGPYSHLWERIFPQYDHEKTTQDILRKKGLNKVADLLAGKHELYPLISSTIDVDKLDYMARDSHFTGVSYGVTETDFIIDHIYIKDKKIIIKKSAISSVEDLITQRVNLFKTVYLHKFAAEYDFLFTKIFQRVRELLKLKSEKCELNINKHLLAFFNKTNTLEDLQALNDYNLTSQIFEWAEHSDKLLSKLCSMFMNREKFKVINLHYNKLSEKQIEKLKKKVSEKYDLKYFWGEFCFPIKIIQTPIYVELQGKLKKLSEVSELIKFYETQKWNVQFLIIPRNVDI